MPRSQEQTVLSDHDQLVITIKKPPEPLAESDEIAEVQGISGAIPLVESEFDEAIYLTSKLNLRYSNIEVFVRILDDELVDLVKKYNAKTFSSSFYAFKKLQKIVSLDSAISVKQ